MTILELADGGKITVGDALKYINLDIVVPPLDPPKEYPESEEDEFEADKEDDPAKLDHPEVPKSLCQDCLDKLQSMYEFKYRCEENREYLKNHVKELADAREAAERAAREAIVAELQFDINNIDSLPDKLIPKADMRQKRTRKPKDPNDSGTRKKRTKSSDRSVIIAEDSQTDNAIYIRTLITTPEKNSPEAKTHSSKRKSKHVVIQDIAVGEKPKPQKYDRNVRKKEPLCDVNNQNDSVNSIKSEAETSTTLVIEVKQSEPVQKSILDDEPIFEDDEEESKAKRPKRTRK